ERVSLKSQACGLAPQGYSPWTSRDDRLRLITHDARPRSRPGPPLIAVDTSLSPVRTTLLLEEAFSASGSVTVGNEPEAVVPRGPGRVALGSKPAGLRLQKYSFSSSMRIVGNELVAVVPRGPGRVALGSKPAGLRL